jgi:hypothetical protein
VQAMPSARPHLPLEDALNTLELPPLRRQFITEFRMGRSYWFECSKCGYRAKVSGKADRGRDCFVQTIVCRDCKMLYDAVTRVRVAEATPRNGTFRAGEMRWGNSRGLSTDRRTTAPPSFQSVLNRLPATGMEGFKWLQFKLQCPISSFHRVESWNDPDRCPRCGLYLEKNALPYRIWE